MRIAVIGSGIAGMAAAYFLSRRHQVSLFEKDGRLGGHTHTVAVDTRGGPLSVDTGFIVHNDRTYPNLVRLLAELGVETQPSDMSFSVSSRSDRFEYSSRGLSGFFAQRSNLLRAGQYRLLAAILRFNRDAPKLLMDPSAGALTLGEMMDRGRYPAVFAERYLYPMAGAVWSMSLRDIRDFPALTLVRFFENHGLLSLADQPQWRVIRGGSARYIAPLTAPFRDRVALNCAVERVGRGPAGVALHFAGRPSQHFDQVVFACHGDQALRLLESPTDAERQVLGCFATSRNEAWLHTDSSLLPRSPRARASWNCRLSGDPSAGAAVTYHMNRLQSLKAQEDFCVSLNAQDQIDPAKVLRRIEYRHPLYTRQAVSAQGRWAEVSGRNRSHFCGAYWHYGFHEDGLNSALRVARALGVAW